MPNQTAKHIKDLRYRLEMTQEQFAATIGVSASSVRRWENGECSPSPLVYRILEKLNTNQLADTLC